MLEWLIELDRQLFLFLNGLNAGWLDPVMQFITEKYTWFPVYGLVIAFIIWRFRWQSIMILVSIAMVVAACDQTTSAFMKPFFERFRPCHQPDIQSLVHVVEGCGGKFGYASSHAANTFGVAMFLFHLFRHFYRNMGWVFVWAAVVSYSRIYVGVHYPGDILTGALIGCFFGYMIFYFYQEADAALYKYD